MQGVTLPKDLVPFSDINWETNESMRFCTCTSLQIFCHINRKKYEYHIFFTGLAYLLIPRSLIYDRRLMWFAEIAICFSPSNQTVNNTVKEFTKNTERSKGPIQPSGLAFLIFFPHFPLKFVTFDMLRVRIRFFFLLFCVEIEVFA